MPYEFLTEEWMTEAKRLRDEAGAPASPPAHVIRMNQVITGAPFNGRRTSWPSWTPPTAS